MGITVFHYTIPSQDHQSRSGTMAQQPLQQTPLEAIWALSAEDLVSFRRIIVTMTEGCFTIRFQPIDMKTFGLGRSHFLTFRCLSTTHMDRPNVSLALGILLSSWLGCLNSVENPSHSNVLSLQ